MEKITSPCIDHDILEKGMYVSRTDGDIATYDLRMVKSSCDTYLNNDDLHTFEHPSATYIRDSAYSDAVIYTGPMGCRAGFYFLARDSTSKVRMVQLAKGTMALIVGLEGNIPGVQKSKKCSGYLDHDLTKVKAYAKTYDRVMKG